MLLLAATGCGSSPAAPPGGEEPAPLQVSGPLADAKPWLGPVERLARPAGAGAVAALGLVAGQQGDRAGAFVELPSGRCLLAVARASSTVVDADVHIFSDSGDLLAADESRSPEAGVLVCPPLPGRVYVSGRIVSGHGVLAVGAAEVPPAAAAPVALAVGARFGTQSGGSGTDPWSGLERAQQERHAEVGRSWPELRRLLLPVEARAWSYLSVPVGANRCIDVLSVPGDAVQGLEMAIATPDGRVVAQSPANGRARAQAVCARADQVAVVKLRAIGTAGVAVVLVRQSAEGASTELDAPPWLDEPRARHSVAEASAALVATLHASWGPVRRAGAAVASVGPVRRSRLELAAGCTRVDIVAGEPLTGLVAELWSDEGQLLAASPAGEQGVLFFCGEASSATVEVSARVRSGPFEIQLRHTSSVPKPAREHGRGAARLLGRFAARGRALGPAQLGALVVVEVAAGRRMVVPVAVPAGGCARVAAALEDDPDGRLRLRLVGEPGARGEEPSVIESEGRGVVDGRLCRGGTAGRGRLELETLDGRGTALLLIVDEPPGP